MNTTTASEPGETGAFRKLGLLASLYFSQGLPFGFFAQALPVLLRKQGFSLGQVGLSSLLATPWALKFLWAPLVDRYNLLSIGRRKSWIVPLQIASVVVLLGLGFATPEQSVKPLLWTVFLLNFLAATQDIATDGLAIDMLVPAERGFANGLQVAGYRIGMIVGGGALLILHDRIGPAWTYFIMAGLTAAATLPIVFAREPNPAATPLTTETKPAHFLRRKGGLQILVLLVTYKIGDAFATAMLRPFLIDAGYTLSDIGWLLGTLGFIAGLCGALLGGILVNELGRKFSLIVFAILETAAVAGYAFLAVGKFSQPTLYVLCAAEHLSGGMATAALFTCMMDWCSSRSSATDYTVQASAVVIASGVASAAAGFSAQTLGYFWHFVVATILAMISTLLAYVLFPSHSVADQISRGFRPNFDT